MRISLMNLSSYLSSVFAGLDGSFDSCANGLQVEGKEFVSKVAFGVSASLELFKRSKESRADAIICHHGLNFCSEDSIENSIPSFILQKRLKYLYQNGLSLFGFHYFLDSHPEIGNNAQIIKKLGYEPKEKFGEERKAGEFWGWGFETKNKVEVDEIFQKTQELFSGNSRIYRFGKSKIKRVAVVSGGGSFMLVEAWKKNFDLLITGEVKEKTQEIARELSMNLIWGGHYITETFGIKALKEKIEKDLGLETEYVEVMNLS